MIAYLVDGLNSIRKFSLLEKSDLFLKQMYELIQCDWVTCFDLKLKDGTYISIWSDDEAFINQKSLFISYFDFNSSEVGILGNFIITGIADDKGNTTAAPSNLSLNDVIKEQAIILKK